jgi:hypothetical protein
LSEFAVLDIPYWWEGKQLPTLISKKIISDDFKQWYGFEFGKKVERVTPLKENAPRVAAPYAEHIFYYPQVDTLAKLSEGKSWKFADIRPDAIVTSNLPPSLPAQSGNILT